MERDMLEQLYREHYRAAWLFVLSLCRDPTLAEDLVADAFVKAYLSFPEAHTGFRFWLLRVCRNLWLDHLRRESHREHDPPEPYTDRTPEHAVLEQERNEALYRCIETLPLRDRELLRCIDVLVDGPFIEAEKDITLQYAGSRNQRVIDVAGEPQTVQS